MGILEDMAVSTKAEKKLEAISEGKTETLTVEEAKSLLSYMAWLSNERESLLEAFSFDD